VEKAPQLLLHLAGHGGAEAGDQLFDLLVGAFAHRRSSLVARVAVEERAVEKFVGPEQLQGHVVLQKVAARAAALDVFQTQVRFDVQTLAEEPGRLQPRGLDHHHLPGHGHGVAAGTDAREQVGARLVGGEHEQHALGPALQIGPAAHGPAALGPDGQAVGPAQLDAGQLPQDLVQGVVQVLAAAHVGPGRPHDVEKGMAGADHLDQGRQKNHLGVGLQQGAGLAVGGGGPGHGTDRRHHRKIVGAGRQQQFGVGCGQGQRREHGHARGHQPGAAQLPAPGEDPAEPQPAVETLL